MAATDQKERLKLVLTEKEAAAVFAQGKEAVIFYLLALSKRIQEIEAAARHTPSSTPSGSIPPYEKPPGKKKPKRPGQKPGHPGCRRPSPPRIDRQEVHELKECPDCHTPVDDKKPIRRRKRIIEDLRESEPEATEHTVCGYWCRTCKKIVEPKVVDALPKAAIGHRAVVLTAWLHYGLGITLSQIVEILNHHFHFKVSPGGLVQMWDRIQVIFHAWYEEIGEQAREGTYLHGDETGWRVNGQTYWLWCFTNALLTYYLIDPSRGAPALHRFFGEEFKGCLITDFWKAYDIIVTGSRQYCLAHLLGEIHDVDARNDSEDWQAFSKKTRRLFADALRLRARKGDLSEEEYQSKNGRLDGRLEDLILKHGSQDRDVKRLSKRLAGSMDGIFTFLDNPDVDATNNRAEREIRPAVIMRKNSFQNRSEKGANCQAVFMSIYRTLKLRGHDPIDTMVNALREWVETNSLPPLPAPINSSPP